MATISEAFAVALNHHRAGELPQAERLYRQILNVAPDHADALHYLGVLASQTGNQQAGAELIERAIAIRPRNAVYHYHLGNTLQEQGKLDQAVAAYERALQISPADLDALNNLGNALRQQGKLDQAVASYQRALRADPQDAGTHDNLGIALQEQGRLDEAVASYERALQIKPEYSQARSNLGNALQQQGKLDQAIASYQWALQIDPENAGVHYNLGNALKGQGKLDEAIATYERALQINPAYSEAHCNLGNVLREQGKLDQAVASYQRALRANPQNAGAHNNLGILFKDQGKLDEAVAAYQRSLQIDPEDVETLNNLGNVLTGQEKPDQAIACFERALLIDPEFTTALSHLVHQLQHICCWRNLADLSKRLIEAVERDTDGDSMHSPFYFLALPTPTTAEQQLRSARKLAFSQRNVALRQGQIAAIPRAHHHSSKITLGYLSSDFHSHATSWLIAELLEVHDRSRFEVFGYSYGPDDGSPMRRRVVGAFDRFRDEQDASFVATAERIAADGVDILVDLKGYTRDCRTPILALRPAPIQVNYLGYPGTMGADFMDYILVDDFLVPPEQQPCFTEKLVHLPGCYQVNDSRREISAETPARDTCGLPEKGFVFCSFNNSYKITPEMFDVWMRLLQAVPESVLWLLEANRFAPANLRREAAARGVAAERLVFAPKAPLPEHLARHRLADLFLDTYPVNAHTTASDALWAGLPLVTLAGETFVSRVAGSLLRGLELPELITHSLEQYESLALQLARDADRLGEIRSRLASNRETSDLFRAEAFARKVELAYLTMWQSHQAGKKPRCFAVPPV